METQEGKGREDCSSKETVDRSRRDLAAGVNVRLSTLTREVEIVVPRLQILTSSLGYWCLGVNSQATGAGEEEEMEERFGCYLKG